MFIDIILYNVILYRITPTTATISTVSTTTIVIITATTIMTTTNFWREQVTRRLKNQEPRKNPPLLQRSS